ncbi:SUN domain-containing protein 2-like [Chanos chanos]|uniref:SUN domain-containing protein 2-like n=1 Tax=Chanos chanos TaxID=29144 RepID=A0A6J2VPS9_CHACN|nr:SUN domain-containing protein 2-like [Chanos chanos]
MEGSDSQRPPVLYVAMVKHEFVWNRTQRTQDHTGQRGRRSRSPYRGAQRRRAVSHSTSGLLSSPTGCIQLDRNCDAVGFSSGYSSDEEVSHWPRTDDSRSLAQSPAEAGIGFTESLRSPAHFLAMLYFCLTTAWYSLTPGSSFLDDQISDVTLLAIKEQIYADLHKHEAKWSESRDKDLEKLMREIALLKQDRETQRLMTERLKTDMANLRVGAENVESDVHRQWEQEMTEMHSQITGLKEHVSHLQSTSDLLQQRMDTQENQHSEMTPGRKLEVPSWLLKFLSSRLVVTYLNLVKRPDLQRELEDLEKRLLERLRQDREEQKTDVWRSVGETLRQEGAGAVTIQDMEQIVRRALSLHRADGIGMADYALESAGASVINSRRSETYQTRAAYLSLFGLPLFYLSESPRTVIQPEVHPGKCWAFRGSEGFLGISLSYPVQITHVTLEHLPKVLSPLGHIDSAPRDFAVYGMSSENEEGTLLGRFTYDHEGESIQTFKLPDPQGQIHKMVELHILSNWGHPEYTCVYRFRVHGKPLST